MQVRPLATMHRDKQQQISKEKSTHTKKNGLKRSNFLSKKARMDH